MNDVKRFYNNLKQKAIENPMGTLLISAAVITAASKLMEANTQRTYAKTHAKEVDRRIAKQYR